MTIDSALLEGKSILKEKGIQSFIQDTLLLLCFYLKKDKLFVLTHKDFEIDNPDGFFELIKRRADFEPIAYISGTAEFMSLEFEVNKSTLIPRPDTETLAEYAINLIKDKNADILDIGTGSGCIAISIAHYCKNADVMAVDISENALNTAKRNAEKNKVFVQFEKCDILKECPNGKFDIIVSNPPYIETDVIPTLMKDVKDYEPYSALWGGDDGLVFYRRITSVAKDILKKGGILAFEAGYTQSREIEKIMTENGFTSIGTLKDLQGIERVVYGTFN